MANNFDSLKDNQQSEKFYFIRIRPRRRLNDGLTAIGGGLYSISFPFTLQNIEENGGLLTEVSGTPSSGEYSYNETTGVLTIFPINILDEIVAHYYIFYT